MYVYITVQCLYLKISIKSNKIVITNPRLNGIKETMTRYYKIF